MKGSSKRRGKANAYFLKELLIAMATLPSISNGTCVATDTLLAIDLGIHIHTCSSG